MDTTAEVLLIIVSTVLSVFLLLAMVALIFFIRVMRQVKQITERAENVAETMESAAYTFQKSATPLAVLKLIGNIVEHAGRGRKRR